MADATLELIPYVFFYGRCEEALNFYKSVLGGDFTMQRNSESHMAGDIPADWQDKIMHARFESKGMKLMAADGRAAASIDPDSGTSRSRSRRAIRPRATAFSRRCRPAAT